MLTIVVALGLILNLNVTAAALASSASPQLTTALLGLFAACCGGFIARRALFAPIAIASYAIFWALAIYHIHRFPLGLTYTDLIFNNAVPIAISLFAVGLGAMLGHKLSGLTRFRRVAA